MAASSEDEDRSSYSCFPITVFLGDNEAEVNIPCGATADEVSRIIKETFGIRGSFLLQIKSYDDRTALRPKEPLKSLYLHCSSAKATVLERYKDFVWEIRGTSCKYRFLNLNVLMHA
jgi:hypothetical protein